ncbi:Amuc_1099 family pilus-like system protein [Prosthecobacter sp.]|uniref:Amuc_1099 family pilus-like system protein n=1 Tax=Prosthecobacter sp. TaxID=1965333 RepID=UPI002AB85FE3|nr:Amuc_1099 family pilus-like system protein [Prosthecobacter sp.]MDZ4403858.1 Amuc_1099 family pilus-like system protein [Prosthecobacter sp.]
MQNSQGNYEKIILTISSLLAIGVAVWLVLQSQGFEESLALTQTTSKNDLSAPNNQAVVGAIETIKKKYSWVSPVKGGKAVPLNKSVLLVMKGGQLFDLLLPEPKLREPMTNIFLTGDLTKTPPESQLPDIFSPNVGDLDADDDGFSNLEEFNAKTNPRDANSMPPLTNKLFLRQRISHDYILKMVSGDGATFQIQRLKPEPKSSKFAASNEGFGFERGVVRFKIISSKKDTIQHPTLGPMEVFVLKILDLSTNKEFDLTQGKEINLAEYEAELEFRWKKRQMVPGTVKEGKSFQLPGLGKSYYILKLEETKAVIAPLGNDGKPTPETVEIQQG